MRSELVVESRFPQSYEKLKQRDISEIIDFIFGIAYGTKKVYF